MPCITWMTMYSLTKPEDGHCLLLARSMMICHRLHSDTQDTLQYNRIQDTLTMTNSFVLLAIAVAVVVNATL